MNDGQEPHVRAAHTTGPSVDVLMLARNVADVIGQAVDGVLAQRCPFPVRLVIAEDGSTDRTPAICEALAREHGGRIAYRPGGKNIGIAARTVEALSRCSARYVAICDSDDIWTDPNKLAKQVGFLETHPDHAFSYTDVDIITREGMHVDADGYQGIRSRYAGGWLFAQLVQGNFVNNSTTVARRDLLEGLRPNACRDELIGDHVRWIQLAMRGKAHFMPVRTTAYRQGGVTGQTAIQQLNRKVMLGMLPGLLREHASMRTPTTAADRAILLRKTAGTMLRTGHLSLIPLLFRYLPAVFPSRSPDRGGPVDSHDT
ncbi:MAG TPA: glycosyltransferase [Flavobacteriales bacterium]|nr:glycosyltransferase [Flavobacteriales bacterium]